MAPDGVVISSGSYKFLTTDDKHGVKGRFNFPEDTEYTYDFDYGDDYVSADIDHKGFGKAGDTPVQKSIGNALDELIRKAGSDGLYASDKDAKKAAQETEREEESAIGRHKEKTNHGYGAIVQYLADLEEVRYDKLSSYLQQLSPDLAASIKDIAFNATNMQYGQITERLANIRAGASGMSVNGMNSASMEQQAAQHEESLQDKDGKTVAYKRLRQHIRSSAPHGVCMQRPQESFLI